MYKTSTEVIFIDHNKNIHKGFLSQDTWKMEKNDLRINSIPQSIMELHQYLKCYTMYLEKTVSLLWAMIHNDLALKFIIFYRWDLTHRARLTWTILCFNRQFVPSKWEKIFENFTSTRKHFDLKFSSSKYVKIKIKKINKIYFS